MAHFYREVLAKEVWFYITTHFFGAKYIAERCGMKVAELKDYVFSWDGRGSTLEHAVFCAGGELDVSIIDELFVKPSYSTCNGSYRYCKQRLPIRDVVEFLSDVTGGGDINFGDFFCVELINERIFIVVHRQYEGTHLLEVDDKWGSFQGVTDILENKFWYFQGKSVLSALSLFVLESVILGFETINCAQEYYKAVDSLHYWANEFEYNYGFIRKKLSTEEEFFWGTEYSKY